MRDLEFAVGERLSRCAVLPEQIAPDWADVCLRAGLATTAVTTPQPQAKRRHVRRRKGLAIALLAVLLGALALTAIGVSRDDPWWFMRFASPAQKPAAGAKIVIVERGTWKGVGWILTAYRTQIGTLCYEVTRAAANGQPINRGGGEACGLVPGGTVPHSRQRAPSITYFAGSDSGIPNHVVGAVVGSATQIKVRLGGGEVLTTATLAPPGSLGLSTIRFFAAMLPAAHAATTTSCQSAVMADWRTSPIQLTGLDHSGHVAARWHSPIGTAKAAAALRCSKQNQQPVVPPNSPAAASKMRPVLRLAAPYGAHATLNVSPPVRLRGERMLPSGQIRTIHPLVRCWKIAFSDQTHFGTCSQQIEPGPASPYFSRGGYHVGRDVFVWVVATRHATQPPIATVALQVTKTQTLVTRPFGGVALFAVPRFALNTHGARHRITLYDGNHRTVAAWWVYYHSCRNRSASGGEC